MKQQIIYSPLKVPVSSRKFFILNMNQYRNAHFRVLDAAKKNYTLIIEEQIAKLPKFDKKIVGVFRVFPKTKRKQDIDNVCSVHSKFFYDALERFGKIEDDNYKHVVGSVYLFGKVDKWQPRVEITLHEVFDKRLNLDNA